MKHGAIGFREIRPRIAAVKIMKQLRNCDLMEANQLVTSNKLIPKVHVFYFSDGSSSTQRARMPQAFWSKWHELTGTPVADIKALFSKYVNRTA